VKSFCSVVLILMLLGTLCSAPIAQEDVPAAETDRDDLDKFTLVWPEEPVEQPVTDTEPSQGRPLLRLDIQDITGPRADDQPVAGTDQNPAVRGSRDELTTLIGELREEVSELRHEIRRLRTTVELLSARISGSPSARTASVDTELTADAGDGEFHPFWLPQP